ncbi:hypothetical protein [Terracoccus luteus]|jgi:hypothetical protein|uniref:Uncharacterized protein n=1 Tax=Terracoccus luteus TaxID=53356 RepID=A0A495XVL6_9MICO|nr:hypothetical protein [Terracoccus luteus]MBB2985867.1 hypothetical protein [Terracoccus luteus]MCP2171519.1 hypothetical protein [Terracoccus luteus]RKT78620.1 hypothetical protein DFJ68_2068 [Terracoccus luteus]
MPDEQPDPGPAERPLDVTALLGEAMSKSGLFWVDVEGDRTWPVWHVWDDGAAYVVSGPGEQPLPWLPPEVRLILRSKDTGGRLLTVRAHAHVLRPGTGTWVRAAELLRASRLNAVDDSWSRWADECTVTAFLPFDAPLEAPGSFADADGRDVPARTTATTAAWRPWHWKGRQRRARRLAARGRG